MAFITAETRSDLIELSVAMLKQAPSAALLEELIALSVGGGSLADAADHIAKTDAFKAEYPSFQTAEQYAAEIFDNITTGGTVTADIRTAVIELATGMLTSGSVTKAGLALAIAEYLAAPAALLNTDFADIAQSFQNRADAAEYFVVTKELGGSTAAELAAAIASVTSDAATLTAAKTAADATASAEAVVAGQTFTLTTGLDTLVGGGANDTISAVDSDPLNGVPTTTINAGDSVNAGAGTDKLSIVATRGTGVNATSAQVASSTIEEVALYSNVGAGFTYTVDTTLMTGLTDLYVVAGTSSAAFTGVNSSPNVHLTSTSNAVTVTHAATVATGAADAVTIALNGASATAAGTLTYQGIETFNVVTSGAATGTATRSQSLVSADLETVNVSGSAAANLTVMLDGADNVAQVGTLDASDMTGALVATVSAGGSGVLSVTGGSGNDRLTVNLGAMTEDLTIDGGDGVDTLVVTSAAYDKTSTTGQVGDGVTNMEVLLVSGSASLQAFSNNTFAGLVSNGSAAITGLGTDAASLTMLSAGAVSLARATDGAADAATVTFGSAGDEFTVSTLGVANEETLTINSASTTDGGGANTIGSLTGTDLTSLTIAGTRSLTISAITGTKLATIDASGLSGTGTQLDISAGNSTADMTVTGAAGVESSDGEVMNDITTGSGDDSITVGDYAATIIANNGDNTIVAGDGDNSVTVGKDENTITVGDGDNVIVAGNGDNTITVGGIATSVNAITVGNGDNTITSGAGKDTVTLGTGDDTVDTGAGADKIYMGGYDDDDVINGGAGTDTLSAGILSTTAELAGAQIQPDTKFIDVTPGTSKTSSPAFTAVENVYMDVNLDTANVSAATGETVDFAASSGISNLYLNVTDANNGATPAILTLSDVDAAAIHLAESGTTAQSLGSLVIGGTGQASLTVKGHAVDGTTGTAAPTALTVTDVDALTVTSYISNSTVLVGNTEFGAILADTSETVTVTAASTTAAIAAADRLAGATTTLTVASLSADEATAINLNAGSNNVLALGAGAVSSTSDNLETITATVSDDGTLTVPSITSTGGELTSVAISLGVNSTATFSGNIDVADTAAGTITVGAASTLTAAGLMLGGSATTITGTASSVINIGIYGKTGQAASTVTVTGRGDLDETITLNGVTSLNLSGWTDFNATAVTIITTNTSTDNMGFTGNALPTTVTTSNGTNTITTGAGNDVITGGTGIDTLTLGAGNDQVVNAGSGADVIKMGAGDDTVTDAGAGDDSITLGEGADSVDAGPGADSIILTETVAALDNIILSAAGDTANFALNAAAVNSVTTVGMDIITGMDATDTFELSMYTGTANATAADGLLDLDEAVQLVTGISGGVLPGANSIGTFRGTYDADADTFVGLATGLDLMLIYDADPLLATTDLESVVLVGGGALTITVATGNTGTLDIA